MTSPSSAGLESRYVTGYTSAVIVGFRHRGLKRFFESGDPRSLDPTHVAKLRRILARLNAAADVRFDGRDVDDVNYEDYH
jgi:hypothetical protein